MRNCLIDRHADERVGELLVGELVEVLLVEPRELREIEHRTAERDPIPTRTPRSSVEGELLAVAAEHQPTCRGKLSSACGRCRVR